MGISKKIKFRYLQPYRNITETIRKKKKEKRKKQFANRLILNARQTTPGNYTELD